MRSSALAHAVQLVHRDIQAEEELQGVFSDGRGACVALSAAVQPQGLAHLFEHNLFGDVIAERCAACCSASEERHKTASVSLSSHVKDEIHALQRWQPTDFTTTTGLNRTQNILTFL